MYDGSLFGKPSVVFAVWGYAISRQRPQRGGEHVVELNPRLLAATFSETVDAINGAIDVLCAPDDASRTPTEDGRRLIPDGERTVEGPSQYRVVNGAKYRAMRDEEERRVYLREAQRKHRQKDKQTVDAAPGALEVPTDVAPADAGFTWQRASRLWCDATGADPSTFAPSYHAEHFGAIVRAAKTESECARVLASFASDPWVAEHKPPPKHLAANWDKYAKPGAKRRHMPAPSAASEFDAAGSQVRARALLKGGKK